MPARSTPPPPAAGASAAPSAQPGGAATEGQRLLLAVTGTTQEIANACGVSRSSVSHWRSGRKAPALVARAALERAFGIPRITWDRKTGWTPPPPGTSGGGGAPKAADALEGAVTTLDEVNGRLAALRALEDGEELTPAELLKLADTEGKLLSIKLRIERDEELREDRIVRSPMWIRFRTVILDALEPFPDARRALEERLVREENAVR